MSQTVAQLVSGSVTTPLAPPGSVVFVAQNTPPTGWLKANGAEVSRTVYSALFAAINTTFGAGDGSTTFTLPDLRGEFPRGWDDSRGIDSGRAFGSAQSQGYQSHTHSVTDPGHLHGVTDPGHTHSILASLTAGGTTQRIDTSSASPFTTSGQINSSTTGISIQSNTTGISVANNGGTETRPRNIALLACIKF